MQKNRTKNYAHYRNEYKVFVGGLPTYLKERQLQDYMQRFGRIIATKLHHKENGESKGYGFVEFEDLQSVERAISSTHKIGKKEFNCRRVIPEEEIKMRELELISRKIFVGGLSESVRESDLGAYFSEFGYIEEVILHRDHSTGQSRCCGFIIFGDKESAQRVLTYKKEHILDGKAFGCDPCKLRGEGESKEYFNNNNNLDNPDFQGQRLGYDQHEMGLDGYGDGYDDGYGSFSYDPSPNYEENLPFNFEDRGVNQAQNSAQNHPIDNYGGNQQFDVSGAFKGGKNIY